MSSDPAIRVEGLGKCYRVDRSRHAPQPDDPGSLPPTEFWALRDIGFTVARGETLGIVGRNGAGKSTLLKVLAAVTDPSEGRAVLDGRVGSLLEVGAGFHGDLTGRDNIFLVGSILGMRRRETLDAFDDILEFSGVAPFIDRPVKKYSSGMYLRLAFAVAAHLSAEILLIDEALAVGDQAFQEKCVTKLRELAATGRTVLFVSHDAGSIVRLCGRALLLERGGLVADGPAADVLKTYSGTLAGTSTSYRAPSVHGDRAQILAVTRATGSPDPLRPDVQRVGRAMTVDVDVLVPPGTGTDGLNVLIDVIGADLWPVTGALGPVGGATPGTRRMRCTMPALHLAPGRYTLAVALRSFDGVLETVSPVCPFTVEAVEPVEAVGSASTVDAGDGVGRGSRGPANGWRYFEEVRWSDEGIVQ